MPNNRTIDHRINYNAQHSPMGAFMSFTCGNFSTRGGIGVEIGAPANQDLYIGVKAGGRYSTQPLKCLPFYQGSNSQDADSFLVEQAGPAEQNTRPQLVSYTEDQIRRSYGWATDSWATEDFTFTIFTPFGTIFDPSKASPAEMRQALLPAVIAELVVDNTRSTEPKAGVFCMKFNDPGWHPLPGSTEHSVGFAQRNRIGVLGKMIDSQSLPELFCRWTPDKGLTEAVPHLLGTSPGLTFEVAPGERRTLRLVFGSYLNNVVTTGLEGKYLYTRYFSGLNDVLNHAMSIDVAGRCCSADQRLAESGLSIAQQFLIAHATRSYYGSTQLLDVAGEPFWIVNEGEYCMMNTLDLSVDQMFWELDQNPWVVKNLLNTFLRHYSYVDKVKISPLAKIESANEAAGGISFAHDMGAHNNFSPQGSSSYELPDLNGCFSYMTQEQLCNWILIAATYIAKTGDMGWLEHNLHVIHACARSMKNRDEPIETGMMTRDSIRCGTGQEITTYDSLDALLGQSRRNLYLGVKRWASFAGLSFLLRRVGENTSATDASTIAIAKAIGGQLNSHGFIPAVFEENNDGWRSRILAAVEALVYPMYWSQCEFFDLRFEQIAESGENRRMLAALKKHTLTLLQDPEQRNLFPDGGIKLSSSSDNSWMSKIALFQQVTRALFDIEKHPELHQLMQRADAAHVDWQIRGSGYWACSDQFVSGEAKGSRYYPRIITSALWLDPIGTNKRNA